MFVIAAVQDESAQVRVVSLELVCTWSVLYLALVMNMSWFPSGGTCVAASGRGVRWYSDQLRTTIAIKAVVYFL